MAQGQPRPRGARRRSRGGPSVQGPMSPWPGAGVLCLNPTMPQGHPGSEGQQLRLESVALAPGPEAGDPRPNQARFSVSKPPDLVVAQRSLARQQSHLCYQPSLAPGWSSGPGRRYPSPALPSPGHVALGEPVSSSVKWGFYCLPPGGESQCSKAHCTVKKSQEKLKNIFNWMKMKL